MTARPGFSCLRRGDAVKVPEGFGKAVRRIIAVLQGDVDHLPVGAGKFLCCQRHAAGPDVFSDSHTAHRAENPLIIERRKRSLLCNPLNIQLLRQILFHIINGSLKALDPVFHNGHLVPLAFIVSHQGMFVPTFSAHFVGCRKHRAVQDLSECSFNSQCKFWNNDYSSLFMRITSQL